MWYCKESGLERMRCEACWYTFAAYVLMIAGATIILMAL
jgi:hypothetical protein